MHVARSLGKMYSYVCVLFLIAPNSIIVHSFQFIPETLASNNFFASFFDFVRCFCRGDLPPTLPRS